MFSHEFDSSIRNVKAKNQQVLKVRDSVTKDDLIKHIRYVTYSLDALRKQMSYFNPGLKYVRTEKQLFSISDFIYHYQSFYQERSSNKGISFSTEVQEDFVVKTNRGMLNQVFDNLFSNSEYWLDYSFTAGLIQKKEYFVVAPERGIILVWDNGVGIGRDIETRLFEPFESKKPGGRGLGLYIASSNLRYNSAHMRLLSERNQFGNLFKFEIDLSQVAQLSEGI